MSDEWVELDACVRQEAMLERTLMNDDLEVLEENVRQDAEFSSKFVEDDYLKAMLFAVDEKADRTERASELLYELSSVDLRSCDDQVSEDNYTLAPAAAAWKEQLRTSPQSVSDLAVQLDGATHEAMLRANRLESSPRSVQPDLSCEISELSLLLNESKVITV